MIGKLTGIVDDIFEESIILNVSGVGYLVFCSNNTIFNLTSNQILSIYIETIVREDAIILFGFPTLIEKECFQTLCKVGGVGNKVSIKILSMLTIEEIATAIIEQDKETFCTVSGVGPKLAGKIIAELDGCAFAKKIGSNPINKNGKLEINPKGLDKILIKEATKALENLGYHKHKITPIIDSILENRPDLTVESLITESLKKINNF